MICEPGLQDVLTPGKRLPFNALGRVNRPETMQNVHVEIINQLPF
jgi:hypothetical protein